MTKIVTKEVICCWDMLKQASAWYTHPACLIMAFVNEYLCVCLMSLRLSATTDPDRQTVPGQAAAHQGGLRDSDEAAASGPPLPIMPFSMATSVWVSQQALDGHFHVAAL